MFICWIFWVSLIKNLNLKRYHSKKQEWKESSFNLNLLREQNRFWIKWAWLLKIVYGPHNLSLWGNYQVTQHVSSLKMMGDCPCKSVGLTNIVTPVPSLTYFFCQLSSSWSKHTCQTAKSGTLLAANNVMIGMTASCCVSWIRLQIEKQKTSAKGLKHEYTHDNIRLPLWLTHFVTLLHL